MKGETSCKEGKYSQVELHVLITKAVKRNKMQWQVLILNIKQALGVIQYLLTFRNKQNFFLPQENNMFFSHNKRIENAIGEQCLCHSKPHSKYLGMFNFQHLSGMMKGLVSFFLYRVRSYSTLMAHHLQDCTGGHKRHLQSTKQI